MSRMGWRRKASVTMWSSGARMQSRWWCVSRWMKWAMERKGVLMYEGETLKTSMYLEAEVLARLDGYAQAQERSRSWMVNRILREKLGMVDEEQVEQIERE